MLGTNESIFLRSYLQVILPVDDQPVTEHVPRHSEVCVFVIHSNTIHAEELGEQCDAVACHDVLKYTNTRFRSNGHKKHSYMCCILM